VFVSLGTVALDGLLVSSLRLGESTVVIGQGVVGLITVQLCKLAGADPVIAVDLVDERLQVSQRLGADYVLNPNDGDVGREVKRILGGPGADVVFECSGKMAGIGLALHCGTPFPKVVAVGMYDGPGTDLYLGEEFCRSAGQILHSRSGGYRLPPEAPGEGGYYHRKWDIVRVTKFIIKLLHTGKLNVEGLITHRFPLEKAPEVYKLIDEDPNDIVKVIFDLSLKA
jgi:threonine dehydrogenase-like Zn-dependent dehydrogenase